MRSVIHFLVICCYPIFQVLLDKDSWTMRAKICAIFKPSMESVLELIIDTKARIEGRQERALTVEECSVRNVGCIRYIAW